MNKSKIGFRIFIFGIIAYLIGVVGLFTEGNRRFCIAMVVITMLSMLGSIICSLCSDTVYFAKLNKNAKLPTKNRENGWYDIYVCSDHAIVIPPHRNKLLPTGIASAFDSKYRISLAERGSNTKSNAILMAGMIDSGYRGEYFVSIYNGNDVPIKITNTVNEVEWNEDHIKVPMSKAICQAAVEIVPQVNIKEITIEKIKNIKSKRGEGKLGSSGK